MNAYLFAGCDFDGASLPGGIRPTWGHAEYLEYLAECGDPIPAANTPAESTFQRYRRHIHNFLLRPHPWRIVAASRGGSNTYSRWYRERLSAATGHALDAVSFTVLLLHLIAVNSLCSPVSRAIFRVLLILLGAPIVAMRFIIDLVKLTLSAIALVARYTTPLARLLVILLALCLLPMVRAGNSDDPKCSVFDGVAATYTAWFISFLGWISYKRPNLAPLLDHSRLQPTRPAIDVPHPGPRPNPPVAPPPIAPHPGIRPVLSVATPPAPADPTAPTADETNALQAYAVAKDRFDQEMEEYDSKKSAYRRTTDAAAVYANALVAFGNAETRWHHGLAVHEAYTKAVADCDEWNALNIQLFGAIISHVSAPLKASLFISSPNDGMGCIAFLVTHYSSRSSGDRAEATARLQRSHIDPRAKLSEADLQMQFNEMSQAAADIVASGGTKPDDMLLISIFENALPAPYSQIRQMVRYKGHADFNDYYNDILSQVKAEIRSTLAPAIASANYAPTFVAAVPS